jgi:glycosyltransferase involved in cell wall biosynthesis
MSRLISLVVPFYNEAEAIGAFRDAILPCLEAIPNTEWEIVCVDDGSSDGTLTRSLMDLWPIRRSGGSEVFEFSRNFGKEAALTAGLDAARGEAVIPDRRGSAGPAWA